MADIGTYDDMIRQGKKIRIALLTPYTGGNLGDAAIQDAAISNIKKRIPGAAFCLISYSPEQTSHLHNVSAFPIGAMTFSDCSLREYQPCEAEGRSEAGNIGVERASNRDPWYKALPKKVLRSLPRFIEAGLREGVHSHRANQIAKTFDVLMVSGGGQLDEYWGGALRQPYALFKWVLLVKRAEGRCFFLSVGACELKSTLGKYFVSHALKRADYRSYRDVDSKAVAIGLQASRQDPVVPDLAFSYGITEWVNQSRIGGKRYWVGVSPIAFLSDKWPDRDRQAYARYISELANSVRKLLRDGYKVSLFSTDIADLEALSHLHSAIAACGGPQGERLRVVNTTSLQGVCAHLSHCGYVVASRLHGVILAHRMRIPVVAVSYDRKVARHMKQMSLEDYCVEFAEVNHTAIHERLMACHVKYDQIVAELEIKNRDFEAQLAAQYDYICGLLG